MRYAEFLKQGGTIGFAAPSFGCAQGAYKDLFDNALKKFGARGYKTVLGPNCYADAGIGISNTPQKCGQELTEMMCSEDSDILLSCGGGELMCTILDFVDFASISQAKPKWYMGYSDNTNFTFLQTTLCDTAAVYAPCASSFGMEPWHESLEDAMLLLEGKKFSFNGYKLWEKMKTRTDDNPLEPYNVTEKRIMRSNCEQARFSGRLIGGCLDCLTNLVGTRFDRVEEFCERYKDDGIVWFVEACDLNAWDIYRALWQMEHAGWFKHVKGFLVGRPLACAEDMSDEEHIEMIKLALSKYDVPVIMDMDLGHLPPMIPMICGSIANITLNGQDINISFECR